MIIRIDTANPEPIYRQIAGQVRRAVAAGEVGPGDKLPSARDLAASLEVNMHTVRQAYAELQQDGLVDVRRGRGVTVLATAPGRAGAHDLARALVTEARRHGLTNAEIVELVEEHL
ncbi:MAG: GntR family transcriptional regulator [Acidimicrobiia bacterium]|nr:GntR family transcriptional regulator [Acidimicrobiia bacterium]MDH4366092.1 GntR family transcriptional regulator [Acidimicrobiia bacterium]